MCTCVYYYYSPYSLDCMEVLVLASTEAPPTTSSSSTNDTITISSQQVSSPQFSTTSLPTITEITEPPGEETSSPQDRGMYICMYVISVVVCIMNPQLAVCISLVPENIFQGYSRYMTW